MARNVRVAGIGIDFEMRRIRKRGLEGGFASFGIHVGNLSRKGFEPVGRRIAVFLKPQATGRFVACFHVFGETADGNDSLRTIPYESPELFVVRQRFRFQVPFQKPAVHRIEERLFGKPRPRGIAGEVEIVVVEIRKQESVAVRNENVRNVSGTRMSRMEDRKILEFGVRAVNGVTFSIFVGKVDEEGYRSVRVFKIRRSELVDLRRKPEVFGKERLERSEFRADSKKIPAALKKNEHAPVIQPNRPVRIEKTDSADGKRIPREFGERPPVRRRMQIEIFDLGGVGPQDSYGGENEFVVAFVPEIENDRGGKPRRKREPRNGKNGTFERERDHADYAKGRTATSPYPSGTHWQRPKREHEEQRGARFETDSSNRFLSTSEAIS